MDDPVPIEGIIEGDPESLAAVCAAGGSAVIAYCAAVGADAHLAETVTTALATFRRGVVESADQTPSRLEKLLVTSTADAVRHIAGVDPSPVQEAAAQIALESAATAPLVPGLAPRVIRALVDAAPVTALDGDPAAVRRATEQQYVRMFGRHDAATPSRTATATWRAGPRPDREAAWVPPELAGLDAEALNVGPLAPAPQWDAPIEPPGDAAPAVAQPRPAPPPPSPPARPPPGTLVIKRGGHWPFKRRPRRASHGPGAASARNVVIAAGAGLIVGGGIGALAKPERVVRPDTILVRPLDTPFTIEGAVFNVARTGTSQWALQIRRERPPRGRTWLTLAAQTRNISRPNLHPRGLGFRLRTAAGIVIGPATALVAGEIPAFGGRLPVGKRTSVHLGFQVRTAQRGLTLEFDSGPRGPTVRVPLN